MLISRNTFFLILLLIFVGAPLVKQIYWLSSAKKATGINWFQGATLELQGGISRHPVILFTVNNDSITFNGKGYLKIKAGAIVSVLYQPNDPTDAIVDHWRTKWLDIFMYSIFPVLVLLVLYLTPDRLDPLIPRNSKIRIGVRPLIKIIPTKIQLPLPFRI